MTEDKKRLKASREIGKALRAVQAIQLLYRITGGLAIAAAVLLVTFDGPLASAATWAFYAIVLLYGGSQVKKQPGQWAFGMAFMISVIVGYSVMGASYLGALDFWGIASAVALWCVLPLAFRAHSDNSTLLKVAS